MVVDNLSRLENIAADVPEPLRSAEQLLTDYFKWADYSTRGGASGSMDRRFNRAADRQESLEAYMRRREVREMVMPLLQAMKVQRCLAVVPITEQIVLKLLYRQSVVSPMRQLGILGITPKQCRERHLAGLGLFDRVYRRTTMASIKP